MTENSHCCGLTLAGSWESHSRSMQIKQAVVVLSCQPRLIHNSQISNRLCQVTWKKNFSPPVMTNLWVDQTADSSSSSPWASLDRIRSVLCTAVREHESTWSLWWKEHRETWDWHLWFWRWGYRGSKVFYTTAEKEILVTYERRWATSEVIDIKVQFLLATQLPMLWWVAKARVFIVQHVTNTMKSE